MGDRLVELPPLRIRACVVVIPTLEALAHQRPLGRQLNDNPQHDTKQIAKKEHQQDHKI